MAHADSSKAILYAFSANLGVALAKTFAAIWTGSGSLLAEAIHSFADCGNQVLLFIGMARAKKMPTSKHPMGYGRESYIWSMVVAIALFSVGGVFSIHEGWVRLLETHTLENTKVALIVLGVSMLMEIVSLKGAFDALKQEKADKTLWQWFKSTYASELLVVVGEDIAALLGLVIAFVMLGLAVITGNTAYDAMGSMLIGLLLVMVAFLIAREVHSLLVGEVAEDVQQGVQQYLQAQASVVRVLNIWAINHGDGVMVALKVEFKPELMVAAVVPEINAMEAQLKLQYPRIKWIFFELDDKD